MIFFKINHVAITGVTRNIIVIRNAKYNILCGFHTKKAIIIS
jgi:hypothetical protein